MADRSRVFAGFRSLDRGMQGGAAPSLIGPNQYAAAVNMTVRGDYITTRPGEFNHPLTFADQMTEDRFATGFVQGAIWYDGENGESAHLVSRAGRLFRVTLGRTNLVTEITPKILITTTADFIVPAASGSVTIPVTSESTIATGDTIYIGGEEYIVTNRATNQLTIEHVGGAGGATVVTGTALLDSNHVEIREWRENPPWLEFVFMLQAENYALIFGGQQKTVIYDGSSARLAGPTEVPPGVMAAYGWGRIWVCLADRRTFVAGDLIYGPSGTAANNYRDSILKFTENTFLIEGGSFSVPHNAGPITSMEFLALPDTSIGVGPLMIGVTNGVVTVNAPVDRTTWKTLAYPIQTLSLRDYGPESPRATINVNGDMHFRSQDGWRSFVTAHRYFNTAGNVPISREITPLLDFDTPSLLFFGSAVLFDNKVMFTISPFRTRTGVAHRGLAVMNLDLLSDLGGKQPAAWEGVYTGLNVLQVIKGRINGEERAFAWVFDPGLGALKSNRVQLWEFRSDGYYDEVNTIADDTTSITRTRIPGLIQTRADDFQIPFEMKKLRMAEMYIDEIVDEVRIRISFRPDQYPVWTRWAELNLCANVSQCDLPPNCGMWQQQSLGYAARVTLPQPPETCSQTGAPVNLGYEFQWQIETLGHCRIPKFRVHANFEPSAMEGGFEPGVCDPVICKTVKTCDTKYFHYSERPLI